MISERVQRDWSRIVVYALIIAFGAYSTVYPIVSVERSSPLWSQVTLGSEFVLAGVFLILGMGKRRGFRMAGLVVVCLGLFTISIVIGLVGGTRVLSYAFLFAAFAMDSVHDIRLERRHKREGDPEELRLLLRELTASRDERNGS